MILGSKRTINGNANCSLHNRFDIEVVDSKTGQLKQKAQAENIILNSLWTKLLSVYSSWFNYIHFGIGIGTPEPSRTSLFNVLSYKAASSEIVNYDYLNEHWVSVRRSIQLLETEYVGNTLTEVGIGYDTTSTSLVTHAMLKDMNGNQISITKTNTDIINIYATVFVYWGDVDGDTGIEVCDQPNSIIDWLSGRYNLGSTTSGMYARSKGYDGGASVYYHAVSLSYDVPNKKMTATFQRLPAASGNFLGGISRIGFTSNNWVAVGMRLYPGGSWFPKSSIIGEAIGQGDGITIDYVTDFSFVKDGVKMYIDGVEQVDGFTIDFDIPITKFAQNFEWLREYSTPRLTDTPNLYFGSGTISSSNSPNYYDVFYNPYYSLGVVELSSSADTSRWALHCSDDLTNWFAITATSIPVEYRHYKYWKLTQLISSGYTIQIPDLIPSNNYKNIHFDTPPASGAVITMDYDCEVIAKDANHVFDLTLTITIAEHVE